MTYFGSSSSGVKTVAGRSGDIVLTYHDVNGLSAIAHSGIYADIPDAPTVLSSFINDTGYITENDLIFSNFAPLNNPSFTGIATSLTPQLNDNSTQVATTAFVVSKFSTLTSNNGVLGISNTYTASGAIATTDSFAVVNSTVQADMTIANNTVDGFQITVKRYGTGPITITGMFDGTAQTLTLSSTTFKESLTFVWFNSLSSYVLV